MGKQTLGYWDYLKAAFNWKVALPLLGGMPLNKLMLGGHIILGFGHPGFWFLGLAYESAYLLWLSGNARFQRLVQGEQLLRASGEWGAKEQDLLARLERPAQQRYRQLAEKCYRILHPQEDEAAMTGIDDLKSGDLNHLLWIFLNLLAAQQKTKDMLQNVPLSELDHEIETLQQKLGKETEGSAVHRSLAGILEIQRKRRENLTRATERLKVTDAELYRIEQQIALLQEELATTKDPETLSARLDMVVKSLQGTSEWMSENAELLTSLDAEPGPMGVIPPPLDKPQSNKGKLRE